MQIRQPTANRANRVADSCDFPDVVFSSVALLQRQPFACAQKWAFRRTLCGALLPGLQPFRMNA